MDTEIENNSGPIEHDETAFPSSEERTFAALAHSSIILPGIGLFVPLVIWLTRHKKSAYTAFHALQALLYQVFLPLIYMVLTLLVSLLILVLAIAVLPALDNLDPSNPWPFVILEFGLVAVLLGSMGLYILGGLAAGILCFTKHHPYYPFFGKRLERYLGDPGRGEERQERVAASACHLGVFIQYLGIFLPLVAWLASRKWSQMLRFQALQALLYQSIAAVVGLLYGTVYLISYLLLMGTVLLAEVGQIQNMETAYLVFGALFLLVNLGWLPVLLVMPIYHTFALVASWKVSHDQDYHYPLIGQLAEKLLNRRQPKTILETSA